MTTLKLAKLIAEFASNIKAEDITILDMRKVANFCDYFVICTGHSKRHVRAIAQGIDEELENLKIPVGHNQGMSDGSWVLLDLGDVVAHIFDNETREFYSLDYLWQEAKPVSWEN